LGAEGQLKQHCDHDFVGAINYDYRGANDYDYRGANNYGNDDSNDHDHDSTDYNHHRSRRCREAWSATFDRRPPRLCEL
jgi:hypothetical protein